MRMKKAVKKTLNSLNQIFPIILGLFLLLSLTVSIIPQTFYSNVFTGNKFLDPLVGALLGSISGGTSITSYILAGEFLKQGVGLLAVTAFMLSWVTVGTIQIPIESAIFGKKFAIVRNIASFVSAIVIAILTVTTLSLI
ncbi:MAG: permease [Candidatus Pacebacteria bacterium]|nr:permease [Candidatus Paceibacterota bacterium]